MTTEEIQEIIELNKISGSNDLLKLLQLIQEKTGYLNYEIISGISQKMQIAESKIYGIATFYNYFRFSPHGKFHIELCNGTACHVNSKENLIAELSRLTGLQNGETSKNGNISIEITGCLGGCAKGPVMKINNIYYTRVDIRNLRLIIGKVLNNELPIQME